MKNLKTINKETSRILDIPEDVVSKVNAFYWKEVVSVLAMPETQRVWLKEIGLIEVSTQKMIHSILGRIKKIRRTRSKEYKNPAKKEEILDTRIKDLRGLLIKRHVSHQPEYNADKIFSYKDRKKPKTHSRFYTIEGKDAAIQALKQEVEYSGSYTE